ncbi:hypothetical protein [Nocardia sp. NBC_01730]|uniref:hypothetical protein n=1 Tax=Nocardia sp. NBC_01730 TaxID=2975998 RepID=UPI003FA3D925
MPDGRAIVIDTAELIPGKSALMVIAAAITASILRIGFPHRLPVPSTAPAPGGLLALGVDYTIFLVTRTREGTPVHGTEQGSGSGGRVDWR